MTPSASKKHVMLVTGLSGAGKSTLLDTLEDMGWEAIDNFPIRLAKPLLELPEPEGRDMPPMAIGFDSRTRGFAPEKLIAQIKKLQGRDDLEVTTLFLDCTGIEIERRYSETRRRHPMAQDRPASDGIAQERELMQPLRRWADIVIDTSHLSSSALQAQVREQFDRNAGPDMHVNVSSFGFSRGVPHNVDMIFDMRFLQNPHWVAELRPLTGLDEPVASHVAADAAFEDSVGRIVDLLLHLLPHYQRQGKAYANIAFGCTGGRHRSVFVAEYVAKRLRDGGFSPTVAHRNLNSRPLDALEGSSDPEQAI